MNKKSTKKEKGKGRPKDSKEVLMNEDNFKQLKKRLVEETSKIDVIELSQKININYKTLNSYINGTRIPKIDVLITIAKGLNVPIDYLLGLQNQKSMSMETREISKTIGLSEKAIENIVRCKDWIEFQDFNGLLEDEIVVPNLVRCLYDYMIVNPIYDENNSDIRFTIDEIEQIKIDKIKDILVKHKPYRKRAYKHYLHIKDELTKELNELKIDESKFNSLSSKAKNKEDINSLIEMTNMLERYGNKKLYLLKNIQELDSKISIYESNNKKEKKEKNNGKK